MNSPEVEALMRNWRLDAICESEDWRQVIDAILHRLDFSAESRLRVLALVDGLAPPREPEPTRPKLADLPGDGEYRVVGWTHVGDEVEILSGADKQTAREVYEAIERDGHLYPELGRVHLERVEKGVAFVINFAAA